MPFVRTLLIITVLVFGWVLLRTDGFAQVQRPVAGLLAR